MRITPTIDCCFFSFALSLTHRLRVGVYTPSTTNWSQPSAAQPTTNEITAQHKREIGEIVDVPVTDPMGRPPHVESRARRGCSAGASGMYRPLRYPHVACWVRRRIFQFGVQRNFRTLSPEARVVTIDVDCICWRSPALGERPLCRLHSGTLALVLVPLAPMTAPARLPMCAGSPPLRARPLSHEPGKGRAAQRTRRRCFERRSGRDSTASRDAVPWQTARLRPARRPQCTHLRDRARLS